MIKGFIRNIFDRVIGKERAIETRLGNPLPTREARERRANYFATMTNGKGFRTPPKTPETDAQGRTRGDRKRLARKRAFERSAA